MKRLYRSANDRFIGGVCGGMSEYLDKDPSLIRLLWVLFSLIYGIGLLAYVVAWVVVPRNPSHSWTW